MVLETVLTPGQGVELTLYAHAPHLLPHLHRVHGCPSVGITMDEEHRGRMQVKAEFGHQHSAVFIASLAVGCIGSVRERIGRIDAQSPLHVAGQLVYVVNRPVGLVHG